jgi:hypothetical protein
MSAREIENGEVAVLYLRGGVIGPGSILDLHEESYVDSLSARVNHSSPFFSPGVPSHTFVAAFVSSPLTLVERVLLVRCLPEIVTAIVQSVVIFVVALFVRTAAKNDTVHLPSAAFLMLPPASEVLGPLRVKSFSERGVTGKPKPLVEPIVVRSIDNGILALREWDQTIGCVERLSNGMPLFRRSGHKSSLKGLLVSTAILA